MKTVITSQGSTKNSPFDKRFGKANWFCLVNEKSGETTFIKNENDEMTHGACKKAADLLSGLNVRKIISGHFGPNATKALTKDNIQMVLIEDQNQTIEEIIESIKP
jgi:predicted Fe-Mo cluster-binding NifX family protein